jgi:ATP-dependent RNA helicase DHX37/DHR1
LICYRQTQTDIPSSLQLQSSASLGTGRAITHQERLDIAEDKNVRSALDGRLGKRKRRALEDNAPESASSDEDSLGFEASSGSVQITHLSEVRMAVDDSDPKARSSAQIQMTPVTSKIIGGALQRNPDGSVVQPKVAKPRSKKVTPYFHFDN